MLQEKEITGSEGEVKMVHKYKVNNQKNVVKHSMGKVLKLKPK